MTAAAINNIRQKRGSGVRHCTGTDGTPPIGRVLAALLGIHKVEIHTGGSDFKRAGGRFAREKRASLKHVIHLCCHSTRSTCVSPIYMIDAMHTFYPTACVPALLCIKFTGQLKWRDVISLVCTYKLSSVKWREFVFIFTLHSIYLCRAIKMRYGPEYLSERPFGSQEC
jgi:hypothetical protein